MIITVAVSGGFDPIHVGHIRLLEKARTMGDRLIVILNSDAFLERKKGRPFMGMLDRREILEAIRWVDQVVDCIDEDQTVCRTLELWRPTIFCNGGDRTEGNIPEIETCRRLGITMAFGVGGGKVRSSTELARGAAK